MDNRFDFWQWWDLQRDLDYLVVNFHAATSRNQNLFDPACVVCVTRGGCKTT